MIPSLLVPILLLPGLSSRYLSCVGLTIEALVVEFACFDSISGSFQYEGFLESFLHYFI